MTRDEKSNVTSKYIISNNDDFFEPYVPQISMSQISGPQRVPSGLRRLPKVQRRIRFAQQRKLFERRVSQELENRTSSVPLDDSEYYIIQRAATQTPTVLPSSRDIESFSNDQQRDTTHDSFPIALERSSQGLPIGTATAAVIASKRKQRKFANERNNFLSENIAVQSKDKSGFSNEMIDADIKIRPKIKQKETPDHLHLIKEGYADKSDLPSLRDSPQKPSVMSLLWRSKKKSENGNDELKGSDPLNKSKLVIRLSCWMGDPNISQLRLWDVSIPGSHNSASWCLATDKQKRWGGVAFAFLKLYIHCQEATIYHQLQMGIRFLDLRVCKFLAKGGEPYCAHGGFKTVPFREVLRQVAAFCENHKSEVIILSVRRDVAYLHGPASLGVLESDFWVALILKSFLGPQLTSNITIEELVSRHQNVLYFFEERERYLPPVADSFIPMNPLHTPQFNQCLSESSMTGTSVSNMDDNLSDHPVDIIKSDQHNIPSPSGSPSKQKKKKTKRISFTTQIDNDTIDPFHLSHSNEGSTLSTPRKIIPGGARRIVATHRSPQLAASATSHTVDSGMSHDGLVTSSCSGETFLTADSKKMTDTSVTECPRLVIDEAFKTQKKHNQKLKKVSSKRRKSSVETECLTDLNDDYYDDDSLVRPKRLLTRWIRQNVPKYWVDRMENLPRPVYEDLLATLATMDEQSFHVPSPINQSLRLKQDNYIGNTINELNTQFPLETSYSNRFQNNEPSTISNTSELKTFQKLMNRLQTIHLNSEEQLELPKRSQSLTIIGHHSSQSMDLLNDLPLRRSASLPSIYNNKPTLSVAFPEPNYGDHVLRFPGGRHITRRHSAPPQPKRFKRQRLLSLSVTRAVMGTDHKKKKLTLNSGRRNEQPVLYRRADSLTFVSGSSRRLRVTEKELNSRHAFFPENRITSLHPHRLTEQTLLTSQMNEHLMNETNYLNNQSQINDMDCAVWETVDDPIDTQLTKLKTLMRYSKSRGFASRPRSSMSIKTKGFDETSSTNSDRSGVTAFPAAVAMQTLLSCSGGDINNEETTYNQIIEANNKQNENHSTRDAADQYSDFKRLLTTALETAIESEDGTRFKALDPSESTPLSIIPHAPNSFDNDISDILGGYMDNSTHTTEASISNDTLASSFVSDRTVCSRSPSDKIGEHSKLSDQHYDYLESKLSQQKQDEMSPSYPHRIVLRKNAVDKPKKKARRRSTPSMINDEDDDDRRNDFDNKSDVFVSPRRSNKKLTRHGTVKFNASRDTLTPFISGKTQIIKSWSITTDPNPSLLCKKLLYWSVTHGTNRPRKPFVLKFLAGEVTPPSFGSPEASIEVIRFWTVQGAAALCFRNGGLRSAAAETHRLLLSEIITRAVTTRVNGITHDFVNEAVVSKMIKLNVLAAVSSDVLQRFRDSKKEKLHKIDDYNHPDEIVQT